MLDNQYTNGDSVEIINYGNWLFRPIEGGKWEKVDIAPYRIGKRGVIYEKTNVQGKWQYAIEENNGNKSAWYSEDQLKKINTYAD